MSDGKRRQLPVYPLFQAWGMFCNEPKTGEQCDRATYDDGDGRRACGVFGAQLARAGGRLVRCRPRRDADPDPERAKELAAEART